MRDWTLPGYKYLGPGNRLDKGTPNNRNDAVAEKHDHGYARLQAEGKNPYLQWSKEDETARRDFSFDDYGGALGKTFFTAKKLAYKSGLITSVDGVDPQRKRLRSVTNDDPPVRAVRPRLRGSFRDSPSTTQATSTMSGNAGTGTSLAVGSGNEAGLKETPIDDPFRYHLGIPTYDHVVLPYVFDVIDQTTTATANYFSRDWYFRMTSPYDTVVARSPVDLNTDAIGTMNTTTAPPDASDVSFDRARWFDFYAGMYNYYHVMACKWTIRIENLSTEPIHAYVMFFNDDVPPGGATNQDMRTWPGVQHRYLNPISYAINAEGKAEIGYRQVPADNLVRNDENAAPTGTAAWDTFESGNMVAHPGSSITLFSGVYSPGDFNREIRLDSQVENWTAVNANPLLPERLMVRIKPDNDATRTSSAVSVGDKMQYRLIAEMMYYTEFKELKLGLRYPVQAQPIAVTIQQDVNTTG